MSELVFSIEEIFSTNKSNGVLGQYMAEQYYIAPYQRGYKWSAERPNGAVSVLMRDLFDAFDAKSIEYYLQYITTKKSTYQNKSVLEVIDGQQRLTTLTLLFSVLSNLTENEEIAIAKNKLSYQVRDNVSQFFNKFIYNNIKVLFGKSWEEFIIVNPDYNEQDIFYLFNAINRIHGELDSLKKQGDKSIDDFATYVLKNVKIILNNVDSMISCEKIFSNLNSNKVELTSAELIKGLFLTKAARESKTGRNLNYEEILETRAVLGRQWDEIIQWVKQPDVKALFFKKSVDPVSDLLLMLGQKDGFNPNNSVKDKYALFNHFQSRIKRLQPSASDYFSDLKKLQRILNNWYCDKKIYNAIGFLFYADDKKFVLSKLLPFLELSLKEVQSQLQKEAIGLIPQNINDLDYRENQRDIHRLLLALSVFFSHEKFDFTSFNNGKWSLEHIFPQTPEQLPEELFSEDIRLINSLIGNRLADKEKLAQTTTTKYKMSLINSVKKKLNESTCILSVDERNLIYEVMKTDKLNSIGNMALLTSSDNSSNRNGMFGKKRYNIINRISNGSFVPKHTYDVFSKLISDKMSTDTTVWTENDIVIHQQFIVNQIDSLKTILN